MRGSGRTLGAEGEKIAEAFLRKKGYRLVERNYRCRLGEVDLIALDRGTVVFIEVKTRSDASFGRPLEAVPRHKQRRMIKTAMLFISRHRLHDRDARFDVVGVSLEGKAPLIEHVENAFELS